jgi:hypothetical protein
VFKNDGAKRGLGLFGMAVFSVVCVLLGRYRSIVLVLAQFGLG